MSVRECALHYNFLDDISGEATDGWTAGSVGEMDGTPTVQTWCCC